MSRRAGWVRIAARRRGAQLSLAALLVTACGSTVATQDRTAGQQLGQPAADQLGGGQLTGGQSSLPGAAPGVVPAPASTSQAGSVATSGGAAESGTAGGQAGATVTGTGGRAPARLTSPIEVGFIAGKCSNCGAVLGSKYAQGSYSDQQFEQAMVDGINSRGGIAGRKIKPVFAEVDTASPDWSSNYQAACATFTEDHHVVAVLGYSFAYMDNFAACIAKAGAIWINGGYGGGDKQVYRQHPKYFTDAAPSEDAALLISVSSAVQDGWVTSRSRLGILQADCPSDTRAFNNTLKPYLTAQHLNLVSNQVIKCVAGAQDDGNAVTFIQHAELQMRSDGVDSVIITGIPLILFAENAESQQWRPHYLAYLGGAAYEPYLTASQLSNIHGAGWLPSLDLNATHQPPLSAVQRTCKDLLDRGGVDTPPAQYTQAFIACDGVLLYAKAVEAAGGDATPAAVAARLEALGRTYPSAVTLGGTTSFGPGRHDGPATFRSNVYQSACGCFQYVGPPRPFPQT
jgi:ABC-type branched-subunit amino acid transport system substrate-binding protein